MNQNTKITVVVVVLSGVFLALAAGFWADAWGHLGARDEIPPVDSQFNTPDTFRQSYAELMRTKADLSDFDCYACHDKGKPPPIRYDKDHKIVVPQEHAASIVMAHGSHDRNNLCFNCHDEQNLEQLQTRDGKQLKLHESTRLCGSCHGPTYRDWEAGVHGRTGGYWDARPNQERTRLNCVDCHNPHKPKIPGRHPAPPPHRLHPVREVEHATTH